MTITRVMTAYAVAAALIHIAPPYIEASDEFGIFDSDPESIRSIITPHARNYLTIDNQSEEVKFQVSVKARVFPYRWTVAGSRFFVAYSQTSFLLIEEPSQPFGESNHNFELFLRRHSGRTSGWRLGTSSAGYHHESNGRDGRESRSWERLFFDQTVDYSRYKGKARLQVGLRLWHQFAEERTNEDIQEFAGYGELRFAAQYGVLQGAVRGWIGAESDRFSYQAEAAVRFRQDFGVAIYAQYWNGYGESLLDYNIKNERVRLGLLFGW